MIGTLSEVGTLRGSLEQIPQISGTLSHSGDLSGTGAVEQGASGTLSVVGGVNGVVERDNTIHYYSGEYTVTPSSETQVLHTDGKMLSDDITVAPVPANYGLITWNGSWLTVS